MVPSGTHTLCLRGCWNNLWHLIQPRQHCSGTWIRGLHLTVKISAYSQFIVGLRANSKYEVTKQIKIPVPGACSVS